MTTRTLHTDIVRIRRIRNTPVGGPRFEITTTSGARFRTKPNATYTYALVPDRLERRAVVLEINGRNQVESIEIDDTANAYCQGTDDCPCGGCRFVREHVK